MENNPTYKLVIKLKDEKKCRVYENVLYDGMFQQNCEFYMINCSDKQCVIAKDRISEINYGKDKIDYMNFWREKKAKGGCC